MPKDKRTAAIEYLKAASKALIEYATEHDDNERLHRAGTLAHQLASALTYGNAFPVTGRAQEFDFENDKIESVSII